MKPLPRSWTSTGTPVDFGENALLAAELTVSGGRSRSGAQVTSWISSENHRSHSSLQAHRANPLDHAQDGQGAGSPRQHCGANLAGARTQTSPAKELQTVTGPEVRRKASGKDRKVSSAAGGNLSRMHKTQETAKESRLNFMYSHLRNRTLAFRARINIVCVFHMGIFARKTPSNDCWKSSLTSQSTGPKELEFIPENRAINSRRRR